MNSWTVIWESSNSYRPADGSIGQLPELLKCQVERGLGRILLIESSIDSRDDIRRRFSGIVKTRSMTWNVTY
jgi:hypothetical protein